MFSIEPAFFFFPIECFQSWHVESTVTRPMRCSPCYSSDTHVSTVSRCDFQDISPHPRLNPLMEWIATHAFVQHPIRRRLLYRRCCTSWHVLHCPGLFQGCVNSQLLVVSALQRQPTLPMIRQRLSIWLGRYPYLFPSWMYSFPSGIDVGVS